MSLPAGMARMERARKDLLDQWRRANQGWQDANAKQFEEHVIQAIDADLRQAVSAMQQMAAMVDQARRDCE